MEKIREHRASFVVVDVVDVSETEARVRVQVDLAPSHWGFSSALITFLVPRQDPEIAVRERVCWKIRQETGLTYLPDELQSPLLEAPSASNSVEEPRLPGVLNESDMGTVHVGVDVAAPGKDVTVLTEVGVERFRFAETTPKPSRKRKGKR